MFSPLQVQELISSAGGLEVDWTVSPLVQEACSLPKEFQSILLNAAVEFHHQDMDISFQ